MTPHDPLADDLARTEGVLDSREVGEPAPPALDGPLAAGQRVGEYELIEQAGAGGFSVVWRARHAATGEIVALKLPRVPEFVSHLRREALVASQVHDPQVVGVREVCLDHDPPFLVMPYVDGENLVLPDEAPAPEHIIEALRHFSKILEVVARLHNADVVHGDLKPGNIRFGHNRELSVSSLDGDRVLLDQEGICYLLDLGLARLQVSARQQTSLRASVVSVTGEKIGGTLDFMAPEVMSGEKPTKASDVYALGVILHHMLCGKPPAFGVSPQSLNPYLPPGTSEFLRGLLHPDPAQRCQTAFGLFLEVNPFIAAEERCLRRRNGHQRRLVFQERMKTVVRGLKVIAVATTLIITAAIAWIWWDVLRLTPNARDAVAVVVAVPGIFLGAVGVLLGMTTINASLKGIPEKTYKNRRGHPLWTFMMQ